MIYIKKTTIDDVKILSDIQKEAFKALFDRYHDASNPYLRGIEDVANRIDSPYFKYFTIYLNDEIVGGVLYKCKGQTLFFGELKEGEYYLQRVYVKPEHQNKRIAQTAILLCEKELESPKFISVDFPQDLEKNRRCYEKVGFVDTGKREETDLGVVLACFEKYI